MKVRAAVIVAPGGPVEVRELDAPVARDGGAVLQVEYSEVCGTDVHLLHGRLRETPYPLVPGHFSVGRLLQVSPGARDALNRPLHEGQRVTFLDVHGTCGRCWHCLVARASTRCPHRRVYGITYGLEDGLLGGWSEQVELLPGTLILPLPEGLDPMTLMAGGCAVTTALHAVDRAELRLGEAVAVLGAGPVGLMACALARLSGAGAVFVVDPAEQRAQVAAALGATATYNPPPDGFADLAATLRDHNDGRGPDVVFECTGNPLAVSQALDLARDAGRVVVVGQYTDAGSVEINPHWQINRKHLDVRGCWGIDFSHLYRAVALLARERDRFPWTRVISDTYPLDRAAQALEDVERRRVIKAVIAPGARP